MPRALFTINSFAPSRLCVKINRASALSPRPRRQRQDLPLPRRNPRRPGKKDPGGQPLILLAPKQATFQLERQLLADDSLHGYTRLHIFSFERLARFILDELGVIPPKFLTDEGRVMVLRALADAACE